MMPPELQHMQGPLLWIFLGLWLADKAALYVSKWRNGIPVAHAGPDTVTKLLRNIATAVGVQTDILGRWCDTVDRDHKEIRTRMRDVQDTVDDLNRRLRGHNGT